MAYIDGSGERHARVGWVAGFGCTIHGEWEKSGPLPAHSQQTNNRAEMMAVICLLEYVHGRTGKLATATDSQYVYDGVTGSAYKCRDMGWVNSQAQSQM